MKRDTFKILAEKYESVYTEEMLREAFDKDLKLFEQYLIQEGLWDTIKQKGSQLVGGAKNALIQPLVKMVLNQIAQSDPEGYKRLQAAAQNPQQLQALLNSPEVQQQQQAIGQDVAATAESIADDIYYEYLNEAYGNLVDEAWIDPKTGRFVKAGTPGAVERKTATSRDAAGRFVKNAPQQQPASPAPVDAQQQPASPAPVNAQQQPASPQQGPGTALNPGQHGSTAAYAKAQGLKVAQRTPQQTLGQKVANTADKAAIAGLKGIGKAGAAVGNLAGKGIQALGQTKAGEAAGGFISKAVNWVKQHPKISLAAGLALLAATGGAAAIGAGGIAPLITSTLSAGAAGAAKGGIAGTVFGGIKNLAQQAQDAKSLKDINWKQAGKEALKAGGKGAAIGAAAGAGANVLGKAAAGVGKMFGGSTTTVPSNLSVSEPEFQQGTSTTPTDSNTIPDQKTVATGVRKDLNNVPDFGGGDAPQGASDAAATPQGASDAAAAKSSSVYSQDEVAARMQKLKDAGLDYRKEALAAARGDAASTSSITQGPGGATSYKSSSNAPLQTLKDWLDGKELAPNQQAAINAMQSGGPYGPIALSNAKRELANRIINDYTANGPSVLAKYGLSELPTNTNQISDRIAREFIKSKM